ncbi:replication-relaxation family protein (plasmid) [Ureibacillus chungkukjangi]|uniref:replication-relaxation family protein n=1 Tax=Ureibacillus chungkukjangi TaxID=1202712 RepID=UPI00384D18A2
MKDNIKIKLPKYNHMPSMLLYRFEIKLIEQVYMHRYMRAADIINLYTLYREEVAFEPITRNGISKRLDRLVDSGILKRKQNESMKFNGLLFNSYFYTVGTRGLNVLVNEGLIEEVEVNRFEDIMKKITLPSVHTMATSTLANNMYMYLYQQGRINDSFKVRLLRGNAHAILGTSANATTDYKGLVVPDYVVETEYALIALEVDSGRQGKDVILNKVKRYKKFCESDYAKGKEIYVVFSPIDYSVAKYAEEGTRVKRTHFLKTSFDTTVDWPNNLHVYATPSANVPEFVKRAVDELEVMQPILQSFMADEWIDYTKIVMKNFDCEVGTFEEKDIKPPTSNWNPLFTADSYMTIKYPNKRKRHYVVLRMCPGSIHSYERYKVYRARIESLNESDYSNYQVDLILLYDNLACLDADVIEYEQSRNVEVYLTDKESWLSLAEQTRAQIKKSQLPLWELGSNFTKVPRDE